MMDQSEGKANIREVEALDRAKRALLECRASLLLAVAEGHSEVQKMRFTLEEELPARLKSERRKLQRNFDEAKIAVQNPWCLFARWFWPLVSNTLLAFPSTYKMFPHKIHPKVALEHLSGPLRPGSGPLSNLFFWLSRNACSSCAAIFPPSSNRLRCARGPGHRGIETVEPPQLLIQSWNRSLRD